jgi:ATP-binding cassette, subfamily B, bacterial
MVPILVILIGLIGALIDRQGLSVSSVALGDHLSIPIGTFMNQWGPLGQLAFLTLLTLSVSAIFALSLYLHRCAADARARLIVRDLHQKIFKQSMQRAEIEGAAAQRVRAIDLINRRLPALQTGLAFWYRVMPRSLLTLVTCVTVAVLVNFWLAIVAVGTGYFLWILLGKFRNTDADDVRDWEVPRLRNRMADLVGRAPLLARLQSHGLAEKAFDSEADMLYRRLEQRETKLSRIWPLIFLAIAGAVAILILGLGVNSFRIDSSLRLPAAMVLAMALGAAAMSAARLTALAAQLQKSGVASDAIFQYLDPIGDIAASEQRVGLRGVRDGVDIEGVSLFDSTGNPILQSLSLSLKTKSLTAVLGTDAVSTRALAELIMGFGLPSEGRVTIDSIPLRDIHPRALSDNVMWIEPAGPIWDGTVLENIRGNDESIGNSDIVEALQKLDVYERLHRLPEGLSTYLSSTDSDLDVETTYAIAIARAMVHRAPILLINEPPPPAEHLSEDPCLVAIQELVAKGTIVIVLPHRLSTLRAADRVILLNGSRLAGEGTHARLLTDSDLYRHLNYLLFNPYRRKNEN